MLQKKPVIKKQPFFGWDSAKSLTFSKMSFLCRESTKSRVTSKEPFLWWESAKSLLFSKSRFLDGNRQNPLNFQKCRFFRDSTTSLGFSKNIDGSS
jgi:hypothetical protein